VRFAFYGRISTNYQDPVSSRAWQMEAAGRVIAGRGRIVVEYFDSGTSAESAVDAAPAGSGVAGCGGETGP
jgi:hypothetical protein